jgi:hypothetical protein
MRTYDLRHTFATLWIESRESAEVLQRYSDMLLYLFPRHLLSPHYQRECLGQSFKRRETDPSGSS